MLTRDIFCYFNSTLLACNCDSIMDMFSKQYHFNLYGRPLSQIESKAFFKVNQVGKYIAFVLVVLVGD